MLLLYCRYDKYSKYGESDKYDKYSKYDKYDSIYDGYKVRPDHGHGLPVNFAFCP
jgi:hypothetical protein